MTAGLALFAIFAKPRPNGFVPSGLRENVREKFTLFSWCGEPPLRLLKMRSGARSQAISELLANFTVRFRRHPGAGLGEEMLTFVRISHVHFLFSTKAYLECMVVPGEGGQ
jgi:hypothetical protein